MPLELTIMHSVQTLFLHALWMTTLVIISARWCIFAIPLCALVAWRTGHVSLHALMEITWSALLAAIIAFGAETLIGRLRPFMVDPTLYVLIPRPSTMSLPSAHASIAYAMALALFGWSRPFGIFALVVADLVVMGRVAAGVHYPTDVFAGLLVGALACTFVRFGHRWIRCAT